MKQRSNLHCVALVALAFALSSCAEPATLSEETNMRIASPAFEPGEAIPAAYACEGNDTSPPLAIDGVPPEARSLVLIVDDPDAPDPTAPTRPRVHWVLFDLPPDTRALPEGGRPLPPSAREGKERRSATRLRRPVPPVGRHRDLHTLYALDVTLALNDPTKVQVETAMRGHVLARTELIGTYQKGGR